MRFVCAAGWQKLISRRASSLFYFCLVTMRCVMSAHDDDDGNDSSSSSNNTTTHHSCGFSMCENLHKPQTDSMLMTNSVVRPLIRYRHAVHTPATRVQCKYALTNKSNDERAGKPFSVIRAHIPYSSSRSRTWSAKCGSIDCRVHFAENRDKLKMRI